jgi:TPR repeat protein
MKRFLAVCILVLVGSSSLVLAASPDIQSELSKGLAFARAGDYGAARAVWSTLARHGSAEAQFRLGWLYESGFGVEKNDADAARWYVFAAKREHAGALYNLGVMLSEGRGVPRDDGKAAEHFRQAAIQGHAKAQYNLGILYQTGRGVPKDLQRARFWLDRAKVNGIVKPNSAAPV